LDAPVIFLSGSIMRNGNYFINKNAPPENDMAELLKIKVI